MPTTIRGRSVVVGTGVGDIIEPGVVGGLQLLEDLGTLLGEVVLFTRVVGQIVELEGNLLGERFMSEAGRPHQFPTLVANCELVVADRDVAAVRLNGDGPLGPPGNLLAFQ